MHISISTLVHPSTPTSLWPEHRREPPWAFGLDGNVLSFAMPLQVTGLGHHALDRRFILHVLTKVALIASVITVRCAPSMIIFKRTFAGAHETPLRYPIFIGPRAWKPNFMPVRHRPAILTDSTAGVASTTSMLTHCREAVFTATAPLVMGVGIGTVKLRGCLEARGVGGRTWSQAGKLTLFVEVMIRDVRS